MSNLMDIWNKYPHTNRGADPRGPTPDGKILGWYYSFNETRWVRYK